MQCPEWLVMQGCNGNDAGTNVQQDSISSAFAAMALDRLDTESDLAVVQTRAAQYLHACIASISQVLLVEVQAKTKWETPAQSGTAEAERSQS